MSFQRWKDSRDYVLTMQGNMTLGMDVIVENSRREVLYAVRNVEPYKGMWAYLGISPQRPRSRIDANDENVIDNVLRRDVGIGLEDLTGQPVRLPWTCMYFDPYFTEEQTNYVQSQMHRVETTDGSEPQIARIVISLGVVVKIKDESLEKIKINPRRFSHWEFMKGAPVDLAPLYLRHKKIYDRLGPYENLAELLL